jgi:hypothetical protein
VQTPYRLTVIPAKAGIYRQHEAWIPAFAGMTFGLFYAVLQHERFRLCRVRSAKQKRGGYIRVRIPTYGCKKKFIQAAVPDSAPADS